MTKMKKEKERGFYKPFMKARIEEELHEFLEKERLKYKSWNLLFRELKKRYEK